MYQSNWWNYKENLSASVTKEIIYSLSFSFYPLLRVCFTCLNVTCLPMRQILRNCYHHHYQYYCLIFANLQQWYQLWHHLKEKLSPWTQVKEMFPALSLKTKPKLILWIWDQLVCCASVYKLFQTQQLNECSLHNVFQVLGLLSCLNFSSSSTFKPNMQFQGLQGIWTIQNSFIPQLVKSLP